MSNRQQLEKLLAYADCAHQIGSHAVLIATPLMPFAKAFDTLGVTLPHSLRALIDPEIEFLRTLLREWPSRAVSPYFLPGELHRFEVIQKKINIITGYLNDDDDQYSSTLSYLFSAARDVPLSWRKIAIDAFADFFAAANTLFETADSLQSLAIMMLNAEQAGQEQSPEQAEPQETPLHVDVATNSITLNGKRYEIRSNQTLRWLAVLAAHPGQWISSSELKQYDRELDGVRSDRLKKHLPDEILSLIDSDTGRGSCLRVA